MDDDMKTDDLKAKETFSSFGWYRLRNLVHDWKVDTKGAGALSAIWLPEAQESLIAALEVLEEDEV